MADIDPRSPVYRENEVVTDPSADNAVQIPEGNNDGSQPPRHPATLATPNEVFGDEVEPQPSEPAHAVGPDVPAVPPEQPSEPSDEDFEPDAVVPDPNAEDDSSDDSPSE